MLCTGSLQYLINFSRQSCQSALKASSSLQGQREQLRRAQQPRGAKGEQNGVKKKILETFRETITVFAKCIKNNDYLWLLNRLGLCLKSFFGAHFRIFVRGAK